MSRPTLESSAPPAARDDDRSRDRRTAWFAAAAVLVLLLALYAAAVVVADDQIPTGTRVGGVGIGGLAPSEATARLRSELGPLANEPIAVSVAGTDTVLNPASAGLRLDVPATIDRATGETSLDPRTVWHAFFGGDRVAPVVRADQQRLLDALRRLADRTAAAPVEPFVTFDGDRPVLQPPRRGSRLEVGPSAVAVLDSWLVDERTVELPLTSAAPQIDAARLRVAMRDTVAVLTSGAITLRLPGRAVRVPPEQYAPALSVRVADGRLRTIVDLLRLSQRLSGVLRSVVRPPRSASVERVRGRARIVPARDGIEVAPDDLGSAVLRAASTRGARAAGVSRSRVEPNRSTREVRRALKERRRDASARNGPRRDGPGRDGPGRDGPGRDGPGRNRPPGARP